MVSPGEVDPRSSNRLFCGQPWDLLGHAVWPPGEPALPPGW